MSIQWAFPAWVWPLLLAVAAGAFVWTLLAYRQTQPAPAARLRRLLVGLRTGALLLLLLGMAGPVVSRQFARREPAALLVVVEDSGSMAIADGRPHAAGDAQSISRWEAALGLAARLDSLLARREQRTPGTRLVLMRGNGLESPQEFSLDDVVIPAPTRHGTDLDALLKQAGREFAGRALAGIVLLSDGQQTGDLDPGDDSPGSQPPDRVRSGGPGGHDPLPAPLLAVGLGDPHGPADRMITDLRYPARVHRGDEVQVEFAIVQRFVRPQDQGTVEVRLEGPGGVSQSRTVSLQEEATPVTMTFVAEQEGLQVYRLSVGTMDNERFPSNNQASLAVAVAKERSGILLLSTAPDWDTRFLAQAALGERRLDLTVAYPAETCLVLADSLTPWEPPSTPAQWRRWDGVILNSWPPAGSSVKPGPDLDWAALAQAVQDGLGLLVLPPDPGPTVGSSGVAGPPASLADILPVAASAWRWRSGSFHLVGGPGASAHPILMGVAVGPESGGTRTGGILPGGTLPGGTLTGWTSTGWPLTELPPLRAVMPVDPVPDALVLLAASPQGAAVGDPGGAVLLAVREVGRGRTVWCGGRNLWELAFYERPFGEAATADEQPGRRLLRNLLVWLASGDQEAQLAFLGETRVFQEGQRVRLRAQWRDMRGQPVVGRGALVEIRPRPAAAGDQTRAYRMTPVALEPGVLAVDLPPLPPGGYTLGLVGEGDPQVRGSEVEMAVTEFSIEDTQVQQDQRSMQQLAARHGGVFVDGSRFDALPSLQESLAGLDWSGQVLELRTRRELGSGWPFLAGVAVLLACEWWLRRRHGLL